MYDTKIERPSDHKMVPVRWLGRQSWMAAATALGTLGIIRSPGRRAGAGGTQSDALNEERDARCHAMYPLAERGPASF